MINSIFIPVLTIISLAFIWILWLRKNMANYLFELKKQKEILVSDFSKRDDMVPRLLQSYPDKGEKSDSWRRLVKVRSELENHDDIEKESEFMDLLSDFIRHADRVNKLEFLEAKKDILDIQQIIEKQMIDAKVVEEKYNKNRKQFPYTFISAIFGFRKATL